MALEQPPAAPRGDADHRRREPPRRWVRRLAHLGRVAVISAVLGIMAINNLPDSQLKASVRPLAEPAEEALGLRQNWALFAPNPARRQSRLVAQVEFVDGRTGRWDPPAWGGVSGSYTGYRWRKWTESVLRSKNPVVLREGAKAIGRFAAADGRDVRRVTLWRVVDLIGKGTDRPLSRHQLISIEVRS